MAVLLHKTALVNFPMATTVLWIMIKTNRIATSSSDNLSDWDVFYHKYDGKAVTIRFIALTFPITTILTFYGPLCYYSLMSYSSLSPIESRKYWNSYSEIT